MAWGSVFHSNPLGSAEEVTFNLRDYLGPYGRYPYEQLSRDMQKAFAGGRNVYLLSVPGFLIVSAVHTGKKQRKPWCASPAGPRRRCYETAAQAIRNR